MKPIRTLLRTLLVACALAGTLHGHAQNVPARDPYAHRIQHCLKITHENPQDALPLADALLATPRLPDGPRLGAMLCRAQALRMMGKGAQARTEIEQAQPLLDAPGIPDAQRFSALMNLAGMLQSMGQTTEALALLERALDLAGRDGSRQEQLAALHGIAMTRAVGMNDNTGAEAYFQRALALVDRYRMPPSMAELMLHYNYGYTLLLAGRHDDAEAALTRAMDMAAKLPGQDQLRHRILSHRGEILRAQGEPAAALSRLERARAWQHDNRDAQAESVTLARLARLRLEQGQPQQALAHADRALALAEQGTYHAETRTSLDLLVDVHAALGNTEQVSAFARRALAFERESAREADLDRLASLQARAEAAATARPSSPRASVLRDTAIAALALLLVAGAALLLRSRRRQRQLAALGATDPLTGLYNRREAARRIEALPAPASSGDTRHALLLVDLDSFKSINDVHGHATGDRVLTQVAGRLRQACDGHDILARWGGEEFLVARPDTSREAAFAFADHLRRAVEREPIDVADAPPLAITVSVGLAPSPFFPSSTGSGWQESIGMADRALYVAKHAGRNAWAGIWGLPDGDHADLYSVRENPEHALAQGWIAIGGNRPMSWSPVRDPGSTRKGRAGDADQGRHADHAS